MVAERDLLAMALQLPDVCFADGLVGSSPQLVAPSARPHPPPAPPPPAPPAAPALAHPPTVGARSARPDRRRRSRTRNRAGPAEAWARRRAARAAPGRKNRSARAATSSASAGSSHSMCSRAASTGRGGRSVTAATDGSGGVPVPSGPEVASLDRRERPPPLAPVGQLRRRGPVERADLAPMRAVEPVGVGGAGEHAPALAIPRRRPDASDGRSAAAVAPLPGVEVHGEDAARGGGAEGRATARARRRGGTVGHGGSPGRRGAGHWSAWWWAALWGDTGFESPRFRTQHVVRVIRAGVVAVVAAYASAVLAAEAAATGAATPRWVFLLAASTFPRRSRRGEHRDRARRSGGTRRRRRARDGQGRP